MGGTIAEIELPTDEFALERTLTRLDGLEFEVERVVAHEPDRVMPFIWVSGVDDSDSIERTMREDPSVENLSLLADLDDEYLCQMEWVDQIQTLVHMIVEEEATILAAVGNDEGWYLRVLFPEREALSRTYEHAKDAGLSMEIRSIYQLEDGREGRFGLTDEQQDTLSAAYDHGYYEIPRDLTLEDLAEELGVSHQALSERLRRGHRNVVKNTVILGRDTDVE